MLASSGPIPSLGQRDHDILSLPASQAIRR